MTNVHLTVDRVARAAYVRLLPDPVSSTESVCDAVLVDLSDLRVVVGVEFLSLDAEIPFTKLREQYHVHSDTLDALRRIQPSVSSFLVSQATDGAVASRPNVPQEV